MGLLCCDYIFCSFGHSNIIFNSFLNVPFCSAAPIGFLYGAQNADLLPYIDPEMIAPDYNLDF